ncbi:MAG: SnoaL-like domain-containing protein [Acidobacteriota bacterium]
MSDIATLDAELNQTILAGQIMEAFEKFFAEDCTMQENSNEPTVGKDANRQRELDFLGAVDQVHGIELVASATATGDGVSFSEWTFDMTMKGGDRKKLVQTSVRRWRDGRVIRERFYYDSAA